MKTATLEALLAARTEGRPVVLASRVEGTEEALLAPDGDTRFAGQDLADEIAGVLRADRPRLLGEGTERVFLNPFNPPLRLVVTGAVHIAQALAPMARAADYRVSVIDPRGAFATRERFPAGTDLREDWPDDVFAASPPDARTAIVTLTHDPKIDDVALACALRSPVFYIGALGSRKTHAARRERLGAQGFDDATLARIHAPVGLPVGARSPVEIAISILAQMTQVLRRGDG